jgi:hypothetical protein
MRRIVFISFVIALFVAPARAQDDRLTVDFSDPSRPGMIRVNLINGAIIVRTHTGNNVIVQGSPIRRRNQSAAEAGGLRRLETGQSALTVEEENNVLTIVSRNAFNGGNLELQVPAKTNLSLKTVNGGEIRVDDVEGDIEVDNTNGSVSLNNVRGSVVAHATNGKVVASLRELIPNKPLSFSSMNSNVDITLPATAKANLKIRTDNGETWHNFDNLELRPSSPSTDDDRGRGVRLRLQTDRTVNAVLNGGGPNLDLRTLNGNIYIRKAN